MLGKQIKMLKLDFNLAVKCIFLYKFSGHAFMQNDSKLKTSSAQ